jgi:hypothetical protein
LCKEDYSFNFGRTQVAQDTKHLDSGARKKTKMVGKRDKATPTRRKKLQQNKIKKACEVSSQKIPTILYILDVYDCKGLDGVEGTVGLDGCRQDYHLLHVGSMIVIHIHFGKRVDRDMWNESRARKSSKRVMTCIC